jgi:hypothetical protein
MRNRPLPLLLALALSLTLSRADETVPISKERLQELERKAADADRLQRELDARNAEIERLKGQKPTAASRKGETWLPPAAVKAAEKSPPTPPIATVQPVRPDEVVSVNDLLNHYASDPAAAAARYGKKMLTIRGVITELDKTMFLSTYTAAFRVPGVDQRIECEFTPDREFTRVYLTSDKERIIGETYTLRRTFAVVDTEVVVRGRCTGAKGRVIKLDGCTWVIGR